MKFSYTGLAVVTVWLLYSYFSLALQFPLSLWSISASYGGRCNSSLFEPSLSPSDAAVVSLWVILALLFSHLSQRFREQKLLIQDKKKKKNPYSFWKCLKRGENAEKPTRFSPSWRNEAPFLLDMSADNSEASVCRFEFVLTKQTVIMELSKFTFISIW